MKKTEFIELKESILEGQEKQRRLEAELFRTTQALNFMSELVTNLIREMQANKLEDDDGTDEHEMTPPDFVLKNGTHLEIN